MIGKREVKDYQRKTLPKPEQYHYHQTITPDLDTLNDVAFDIKFAGNNAHMSSTVFLERKFTFTMKHTDPNTYYYNNGELELHKQGYANPFLSLATRPGFVLQNACTNMTLQYNSTHDTDSNISTWLSPYEQLYKYSLKNLIRHSGRAFLNKRNMVNVHNKSTLHLISEHVGLKDATLNNVTSNNEALSVALYPYHSDRIDRVVDFAEKAESTNVVKNFVKHLPRLLTDSIFNNPLFNVPQRPDEVTTRLYLPVLNDAGNAQPLVNVALQGGGQAPAPVSNFISESFALPLFDTALIPNFATVLNSQATLKTIINRLSKTQRDNTLYNTLLAEKNRIFTEDVHGNYTFKTTREFNGDGVQRVVDYRTNYTELPIYTSFIRLLRHLFPDKRQCDLAWSIAFNKGIVKEIEPLKKLRSATDGLFERINTEIQGVQVENIQVYEAQGHLKFTDTYGLGLDFTKPFLIDPARLPYTLATTMAEPTIANRTGDAPVYEIKLRSAALAYKMLKRMHDKWYNPDDNYTLSLSGTIETKTFQEWLDILQSSVRLYNLIKANAENFRAAYELEYNRWFAAEIYNYLREEDLTTQDDINDFKESKKIQDDIAARYKRMFGVTYKLRVHTDDLDMFKPPAAPAAGVDPAADQIEPVEGGGEEGGEGGGEEGGEEGGAEGDAEGDAEEEESKEDSGEEERLPRLVDDSTPALLTKLDHRFSQIIAGFRNAFGINTNYPTVAGLEAGEVGMDKYAANYNFLINRVKQNWYDKMNEVIAFDELFNGIDYVNNNVDNSNQVSVNTYEHTFLEPLVCGPFRPTEYRDIGCWGENSNVFPYINRFKLNLSFIKDYKYMLLNGFNTAAIHKDIVTGQLFLPKLEATKVESKLHVTFISHPVSIPRSIPTLHYDTHLLTPDGVACAKGVEQKVNFDDIQIRSGVQQLMFFCKTSTGTLQDLHLDKAPSIVSVKLGSDVSNQNLSLNSRQHCDAITTRNFPQYCPPINASGNVLAITYNEVPRAAEVATEFDHLRGQILVMQNYVNTITAKVYLVIIYKDTFLEVQNHYAFKGKDLY